MKTISSPPPASAEIIVNENFAALLALFVYARNPDTTSGLTWGYYGGRRDGFAVAAGTLALTNTATNHVVVLKSSGVISFSTATTNWNDTANYARVYRLTTASGLVTVLEDHRVGTNGVIA